ncbi:AAA family ATPase [Halarsenatibacter silvermanii]|uniref:Wobble nucleotide-excising tRNase n=1 Tax=Halarsenatibacter silvermanii TaxID=321763 RepID=A0A1G9J7V3_9FIRM|nr:AAA family ATPase [Halarsenatibacter silvermanii]SDL33568.1 Wobble nucleotide-excising tRNase [Halarsenatibacter silvermanii]
MNNNIKGGVNIFEKVISIKNFGRFIDCTPAFDGFAEYTLIFGENGMGKTTFSTLFNSLKSEKPSYIKAKATLGDFGDPKIELLFNDNNRIYFEEGEWSESYFNLEVFNEIFVNKRVYIGDRVEIDQRKALYNFVLGEEGVDLSQDLAIIKKKSRRSKNRKENVKEIIQEKIKGSLNFEQFLDLKSIENVNKMILLQYDKLKRVYENEDIQSKEKLIELNLEKIPFGKIKNRLEETIEDISENAKEKVEEHIYENLDSEGEEWIFKGMEYVSEEEVCPFCGVNLEISELYNLYEDYFSEEFANLEKDIKKIKQNISEMVSDKRWQEINHIIQQNQSKYDFWHNYIDFEAKMLDLDIAIQDLENLKESLIEDIETKQHNLLKQKKFNEKTFEFISLFLDLNKRVREYNSEIKQINKFIEETKKETGEADLNVEIEFFNFLLNTKLRFESPVKELCFLYNGWKRKRDKLEAKKEQLQEEIEEYTKEMLDNYQEKTNEFLGKFGADFKIDKVRKSFRGDSPNIKYKISLNEVPCDLKPSEDGYESCFGNILSSGDKTTLALAFYLAKLEKDENLDKKILVFDDPISSFDKDRITRTVKEIVKYSEKAKQLILLSHYKGFLWEVYNKILRKSDNSDQEIESVKIARDGSSNRKFDNWDIEKDTEGEFLSDYRKLYNYYNNSSVNPFVARTKIRSLLENLLLYCFPTNFKRTDTLGDMLAKIKDSPKECKISVLKGDIYEELDDLNEYSITGHSSGGSQSRDIDEIELEDKVDKALSLVDNMYPRL